ncbi:MAG: Flagellar biosynthetic protein FlhB [Syntrophus sp. SKADARSKE-3]|nr:Flagellar biosynthetic protein FlhB [Syntrophus sp. SKADARSKE-3]
MADTDQEKTEQATSKREEEARERGQVAKSRELPSVTILVACLIYFWFGGAAMVKDIMKMMKKTFAAAGTTNIDINTIQPVMFGILYDMFIILMPVFIVVTVASLLSNLAQTGFLFSPEAMAPKFSKVDPVKGFTRMFSLQSIAELVKNIIKMTTIGVVAWLTIKGEVTNIAPLINQDVYAIMIYVGKVSFKIIMSTCWILIVLAIMDFIYQKWEHAKSLKMTKEEVKQENKQMEGDPFIKGRIRRIQREIARKRMMAAVPKADVVITNPTHFAVAIKYEQESMNAPVVVAKGADLIAAKIKEIAKKHNVPIIENKTVARLLFAMTEIDEVIPENLYRVVAEILAQVYRLKNPDV